MGEEGSVTDPQMGRSSRLFRVRATGGRRGEHALKSLSITNPILFFRIAAVRFLYERIEWLLRVVAHMW